MKFLRYKSVGWYGESYRHGLAAKGIRTSFANKNANIMVDQRPGFDVGQLEPGQTIIRKRIEVDPETGKKRVITDTFGSKMAVQKGSTTSRKLMDKKAFEKLLVEVAATSETQELQRIASGDLSSVPDMKGMDEFTKNKYRDAVFRGALANAGRGQAVDIYKLRKIGLTRSQIETAEREYRLAKTGSPSFVGEKIAGGVGGVAKAGLVAGEEIAATGLKNLREEWSAPPSESVLDKLGRERAEQRKEEAAGKGVFNPLRIAGLGDIADSEPAYKKKEKLYSRAMDADNEVNSIFNSKDSLASVDLSGYDDGEIAFKTGNREGLIKSITKLETEQMKLKDRWSIVQGIRNLVLSPDNRNQTIHMEQSDDLLSNYLMGSGGGGKLSDQTRKVAVVENKIKNSSNLVSARVGLLRSKLQRMNAAVPPDATVPRRIEVVSPNGGNPSTPGNILNNLDSGKGAFKGLNPWSDEQ